MLDVEAALATVEARLGLIPAPAAEAIRGRVPRPASIRRPSPRAPPRTGNPAEPLVRALRAALPDDVAPYVHKGATSQDIVDTAAMLVVREAAGLLLADLARRRGSARRNSPPRTGIPSSVDARCCSPRCPPRSGWWRPAGRPALHEACRRSVAGRVARPARRAVRRRGRHAGRARRPYGLSAWPRRSRPNSASAVPVAPWHTDRTRIAEIAGALGTVAGAVGKIARDVTLYAQAEIGELSDGADRGGSSTMPHKRNPVAAVAAAAGAAQAPGLVATLLAAMPHEFQRAAGAWHAEWRPLRSLLEATGSAAHWLRDCLDNLVVHPDRMRVQRRPQRRRADGGAGRRRAGPARRAARAAPASWSARPSPPGRCATWSSGTHRGDDLDPARLPRQHTGADRPGAARATCRRRCRCTTRSPATRRNRRCCCSTRSAATCPCGTVRSAPAGAAVPGDPVRHAGARRLAGAARAVHARRPRRRRAGAARLAGGRHGARGRGVARRGGRRCGSPRYAPARVRPAGADLHGGAASRPPSSRGRSGPPWCGRRARRRWPTRSWRAGSRPPTRHASRTGWPPRAR